MRIIGGHFKGKKLKALPSGLITRPTLSRIRESIFNILENRFHINFEQTTVLDGFSGTGSLGFEAASRGAKKVIFLEKNPLCFLTLKENARDFKNITLYQANFFTHQLFPAEIFNLIFLDPPYTQGAILKALQHLHTEKWIALNALIITETDGKEDVVLPPTSPFGKLLEKKYASSRISFFQFMSEEF